MPPIPRHRPMARYPAAKEPETRSPVRKRHGCGVLADLPVGKLMQRQTDADKRIPQTRSPSSWSPFHHRALTSPSSSRSRLRGWQMAEEKGTGTAGAAQVPLYIRPMDGLDALPSPLPRPDPYSFPDLISSSTASSSLHESRGPPVPSCLAGVSTIHSRRSTLGPEAGHARVCRSQPLFMHLISLHRLRGLAASQSFLRTASLVRKEGSQLRLRDDPEPRLCGPCDPATLEGSTPFAASPSDIDGLFWLTSREPQLPASDLLDPRRRRTPKHDAIWPPNCYGRFARQPGTVQ